MSFLPGLWRAWVNRSASGPFLNADNLNDMELKFRALDCLGAVRALGLVDALPGSPADGDAYLTSATATPANKIVRRFDGAWEAFTPINGMVAFLADGSAKQFTAGAWAAAPFSSGLTLGETSSTAHRGDHGATAYAHSQSATNPHGTTAAQVGALPSIVLSGVVDANSINGGLPCAVSFNAVTSWANFPAEFEDGSSRCALLQLVGGDAGDGPLTTQILFSTRWGGMYHRERATYPVGGGAWNPWTGIWDDGLLPVSTFMKSVLDDANAGAARATLGAAPLAGAEVLIHSDFGRSATTDVWQSAFTNNAASGLQFPANSTASGTTIVLESLCSIPVDSGGAVQVCIGPQLSGEDSPSGSTYAIVLSPGTGSGEAYGSGILRIEIELIGSGSSITGHVVASFLGSGQAEPRVQTGTITVDGTQNRTLDLRFNPFGTTAYTFRRNRVFRRNP